MHPCLSFIIVVIVIFIFVFAVVGGRPRDEEHARERRSASVEEGHDLVECGFFEVAIEDCGADDRRESE